MSVKAIKKGLRQFRLEILRPLRIKRAARFRALAKGCFIGVTGSSGKSTTTALIAAVLGEKGRVRCQVMDNTINPLTTTIRRSRDADYVVVEAGVAGKGQMEVMARLLRPNVAVVTLVGLEHYSAFRSSEAIAEEKANLVAALAEDGLAVLNADDVLVMGMARRTRARVVTFGHTKNADCRIVGVSGGFPDGIKVRLSWAGTEFDVPTQFIGPHFAQAVAAAATVGLELGVPIEKVCKAIARCQPVRLRLSVHAVPGGPFFIADTAKAPQGTLHLAFETLRDVAAPRRRIVLGAISDYPGARRRVYQMAIEQALVVADQVILVAEPRGRASYAPDAEAAGRFLTFPTTHAAAEYIARTAIDGEIILLKGSANLHLERIFLNLAAKVRCWENACGLSDTCIRCGLYEHDFSKHGRLRPIRRVARSLHLPLFNPDAKKADNPS